MVGDPSGRLRCSPCSSTYQQLLPSNDMLHVFLVGASAPSNASLFSILFICGLHVLTARLCRKLTKKPSESSSTKGHKRILHMTVPSTSIWSSVHHRTCWASFRIGLANSPKKAFLPYCSQAFFDATPRLSLCIHHCSLQNLEYR